MDSKVDRRMARREFKERKTPQGIYAVRCTASGERWVGASNHLNTVKNSIWFQLRGGLHPVRSLQDAWNTRGADAFEYEILEQLNDETALLLVDDELLKRRRHWAGQPGAQEC